jgi:hypothetical protein
MPLCLRRWLAFIDLDEFIVLHDTAYTQNIGGFMHQYEQYGALAVNWVLLGSSGHKQRPAGGSLINYTKCMPRNHPECKHVKVIVHLLPLSRYSPPSPRLVLLLLPGDRQYEVSVRASWQPARCLLQRLQQGEAGNRGVRGAVTQGA